jgi:hypothetical protein
LETWPTQSRQPPPVAFISFDLALVSATVQTLPLLEGDVEVLLPRCAATSMASPALLTYGELNGEGLTIREFN